MGTRLFVIFFLFLLPHFLFSQAVIFEEDFESSTSFFTSTSASGSGTSWQLSSSLSKSGSFSDSNNVQMGDTLYLTSPIFSTYKHLNLTLSFSHIAKIHLSDRLQIEVSSDSGLTWTTLDTNHYLGSGFLVADTFFSSLSYSKWAPVNNLAVPNSSWWEIEKFDLSLVANSRNSQIRFALIDADNNGARGNYGWLVDDIKITSNGLYSIDTTILFFEDFNAGIPSNWTNTAVSGSFTWMHGKMYDVTERVTASFDSTPMVYFNDDSLGNSHLNNTVELITPVIPIAPFVPSVLEFDYNFRFLNNGTSTFKVEVYDGTTWVNVLQVVKDDCGRWIGPCATNQRTAHIDISNYLNDSLQVKFIYHDGNDWAYWAAFDNVRIYGSEAFYPIAIVNAVDSIGEIDSLYVRTWISGTIAGFDQDTGAGYTFSLIDHSTGNAAGISVSSLSIYQNYTVREGDSVRVLGMLSQRNGLQELIADTLVLLDSNKKVPFTEVNTIGESVESQLLMLRDFEIFSIDTIKREFLGSSNGRDTVSVHFTQQTNIVDSSAVAVGNVVLLRGIGLQSDSVLPYTSGYYLLALDILPELKVNLGPDTFICETSPYRIDAGSGFSSYLWNTGDTTQTLKVVPRLASIYTVTVTYSFGISFTDTINVKAGRCQYSSTTLFSEDFNSGIPSNWTNTAASGFYGWSHGKMINPSTNTNVSIDNTDMIYFDDEALGSTFNNNNTAEIISPVISPSAFSPIHLEFDYNYKDRANLPDSFKVEVYNGSDWHPLFFKSQNRCGSWNSVCQPFPWTKIDITPYANDSLRIKFIYHDGNGWGYWAAFDNVHITNGEIYYPISNISTVDSVGVADSLFLLATTSGTIAGVNLDSSNGYSFTLVDQSTGKQEGISIVSSNPVDGYIVREGDSLLVYGRVEQRNGLQQFAPFSISILDSNRKLPEYWQVSALNESTESKLIQINDVKVVFVDPLGQYFSAAGVSDTFHVSLEAIGSLNGLSVGTDICHIRGIGSQNDTILPYLKNYSIVPMKAADVVVGMARSINLGSDTVVCSSANYYLDAGAGFMGYKWSTGDTTQGIFVHQSDTIYSVTATEANGCSSSDTVVVTVDVCAGISEEVVTSWIVYPNPAQGVFTVEGINPGSSVEVEVLDYNGKVVKRLTMNAKLQQKNKIDLSAEPKGLYIVRFTGRNSVEYQKIILQ